MANENSKCDSQLSKKDPISIEKVSPEFLKKIRTFAALTNNHLMARNTIGDEILESAELMKRALEIVKEIDSNA